MQKLRLATEQQKPEKDESEESPKVVGGHSAETELVDDVGRVPKLSMLAELEDEETAEGLLDEDSDKTEEML